ncbi:hypothetical protein [Flavisolibacter tropicus]|uniref:N-acetyltransferase domain-containing protein n=1 Tax=Flavisolibacter tropicus TaxID=1492898 RepID=A0A172U1G8_9BACT|nr:hypothetical protein [Flavisolibacter tropicus]ANE53028.1 hypothetical protein SY85_23685 [Flavisolibacter tropicus]
MTIYEVLNIKLEKEFSDLPKHLYKNDPNWISTLDSDIKSIFDSTINPFFKHGKCTRWILMNDQKQTIGRIAAFIDFEKNKDGQIPYGGMGFFECIDDERASNLLLDTAKEWLKKHGMQAMYGPINFGENDKFWGLLVDGFQSPSYGMNYNPPYYKELLEKYGFSKAYDQLTNVLNPKKPLPERFTRISDWVRHKKDYSFQHFKSAQKEKFFADFIEIYNDAWDGFENFTPIDLPTIRDSFRQMKPIMDEKIIWFAYHNNEPIAFVICMPDVNQILKHIKGDLNLFNKLKFLWVKKTKTIDRIRITVMGCKKKFQNHGIESALIRCLQEEVLPRQTINEVELAWVGDFNSKMLAIHNATGAVKSKVHRTYKYSFDEKL